MGSGDGACGDGRGGEPLAATGGAVGLGVDADNLVTRRVQRIERRYRKLGRPRKGNFQALRFSALSRFFLKRSRFNGESRSM